MQIIINQKEIEKAIKLYLSNQIMVRNLADVNIELIATRSGEGVKAIIDFTETSPKPDELIARKMEPIPEDVYTEITDPVSSLSSQSEQENLPEEENKEPKARTSLFANLKKPVGKEES